jgi:ribosomal protein S27AE
MQDREEKGQGLCPFCGSSKVDYNKHFKYWICGKCYKSFPSPSYGGKAWFGDEYFDPKSKKWKFPKQKGLSNKLSIGITGIIGLLLLYISLTPVVLNTKNQHLFASWWHCIWAVGNFLDYLRAIFLIVAGLVAIRGILGVLLAPFKASTATKYVLIGGIAGIILLIAFWSGILNGSAQMLLTWILLKGEAIELNKMIVVTYHLPGLNYPFVFKIMSWGWIKLSLAGFGVWVIGAIPFTIWWRSLR